MHEWQWAQTETQEIPFKHKKKLFYSEGGQTPKEVAQRIRRVSIFGDIQNPPGHASEQPAVVVLALSRVVYYMVSSWY